jgi:hypothetical protein
LTARLICVLVDRSYREDRRLSLRVLPPLSKVTDPKSSRHRAEEDRVETPGQSSSHEHTATIS